MKNPAAVALGKIKSAKKAKSSAVNGTLGGRPKSRYVVEQHGSTCYIHDALLGKRLIVRPVAQLSSLEIIAKNLNDSARRPNAPHEPTPNHDVK